MQVVLPPLPPPPQFWLFPGLTSFFEIMSREASGEGERVVGFFAAKVTE
jgi:hypothetical protein